MEFWLHWATAGIWIAFLVYWSAAARGEGAAAPGKKWGWVRIEARRVNRSDDQLDASASDTSRESLASRRVHQNLIQAALLLALLPWFFPLSARFLPPSPTLSAVALGVQVLFSLLYIWARVVLGRHWSGRIETHAGHELIRSGPYRRLRHPMYTALIGMLLCTALVWGEWHALLGAGLGVLAYLRKIRLEEEHLRRHLGLAYVDYIRGSWALLPGIY